MLHHFDQWTAKVVLGPIIPKEDKLVWSQKPHITSNKSKSTVANTANSLSLNGNILRMWDAKVANTIWWVQMNTTLVVPSGWRSHLTGWSRGHLERTSIHASSTGSASRCESPGFTVDRHRQVSGVCCSYYFHHWDMIIYDILYDISLVFTIHCCLGKA